jgi:hypothetical protein
MRRSIFLLLLLTVLPNGAAWAQVDLPGMWSPLIHEDAPQRGNGSQVADCTGLPSPPLFRFHP